MRTNLKTPSNARTHGGARASTVSPLNELRRTMLSCMLWESTFYEGGDSTAKRIAALVKQVSFAEAAQVAIDARESFKLRHAPLFLLRELIRIHQGRQVGDLIARVIQRPDELGELLSLYWKDNKDQPLTAQMKVGLSRAINKFSERSLAKWDKNSAGVSLRDILFLTHARPRHVEGEGFTAPAIAKPNYKRGEVHRHPGGLFDKIVTNTLATPDTWEVSLSEGADKKATFARLITEGKLGDLALLRNLRNMVESGVDPSIVRHGLAEMKGERVLPFRYIAAAKAAPQYEAEIDAAMVRCLSQRQKLPGKSLVVIDVSGSMHSGQVSKKSDMTRVLAAAALGAIARELCEDPRVYATAGSDASRIHQTQMVPARRGMALVDAIVALTRPLGGGGIFLKQVMDYLLEKEKQADRVIVITDEQDCGIAENDRPSKAKAFGTENYLINVATYENGINFGQWTQINGFSEAVFDFIRANEESNSQ